MKRPKLYSPRKPIGAKRYGLKKETRQSKGYDKEWYVYRKRYLHYNPKCYACGRIATVIDHVLPWRVDKEKLFWKLDNFIPLCKPCHDYITGKFDRVNPPNTEGKMKWINEQREFFGLSTRVKVVPKK